MSENLRGDFFDSHCRQVLSYLSENGADMVEADVENCRQECPERCTWLQHDYLKDLEEPQQSTLTAMTTT